MKNYQDKARKGDKANKAPGKLITVRVLHDSWCALIAGKGACNCKPDVQQTEVRN